MVRRKELLDEDYVRNTLKQAGCTAEEIETFIGNYRENAGH
jgi:hypothetical protein